MSIRAKKRNSTNKQMFYTPNSKRFNTYLTTIRFCKMRNNDLHMTFGSHGTRL